MNKLPVLDGFGILPYFCLQDNRSKKYGKAFTMTYFVRWYVNTYSSK